MAHNTYIQILCNTCMMTTTQTALVAEDPAVIPSGGERIFFGFGWGLSRGEWVAVGARIRPGQLVRISTRSGRTEIRRTLDRTDGVRIGAARRTAYRVSGPVRADVRARPGHTYGRAFPLGVSA